jgi:hypothetical protein
MHPARALRPERILPQVHFPLRDAMAFEVIAPRREIVFDLPWRIDHLRTFFAKSFASFSRPMICGSVLAPIARFLHRLVPKRR